MLENQAIGHRIGVRPYGGDNIAALSEHIGVYDQVNYRIGRQG